MKKILLSAAILFGSLGAFAQSGLGYGIKAGVNMPKYDLGSSSTDAKNNTNFFVTAFLDAPLSSNFAIQPGVSLQGKGAKLADYQLGNNLSGTLKQSTMWIEVPVNLVAKLPTGDSGNFFVGAGPYLGFGLSGKNKLTVNNGGQSSTSEVGDFHFGSDANDSQKAVDFGVNFLAGYQLSSGLQLNAGYGLGISNLSNASNGTLKNRVFSVGLGFAL